jgi:LPXTG-site transpeptidase (sortase) family protein
MNNPLFPTNEKDKDASKDDGANSAVNMIRHKLDKLYADEPNTKEEIAEATVVKPRSKHQEFIYKLSSSGKGLAEIQTEWHNYYVALPDTEKHQVWAEFYETSAQGSHYNRYVAAQQPTSSEKTLAPAPVNPNRPKGAVVVEHQTLPPHLPPMGRSAEAIKKQLLSKVDSRRVTQAKHHFKSLAFGLSMGVLVIIIFLFSFFNEIIITPFIMPSAHVSSTPLIIDASSVSTDPNPEVIIPKINVEIPVDYTQTSDDPNVIENALESGVVHYPNTVMPGQDGNAAFFGHSSNNIFNPGKYKFAFVLLHTLVKGDTFYLTYHTKVYVYQVIDTRIVPPSDVSVLNDTEGNTATATLITCDPPGTSINRLVVTGTQISPDPSSNTTPIPTTATTASLPSALPGNGPSLWNRFTSWLF